MRPTDVVALSFIAIGVALSLIILLTRRTLSRWRFGIFFESEDARPKVDQDGPPDIESPQQP